MSAGLTIVMLAVLGALVWLFLGPRSATADPSEEAAEAEEAQAELNDLDAFATPDDAAEELRDWGPGAPR